MPSLASFSTATFPYADPLVCGETNTRGGTLAGSVAALAKRGQLLEISGTKWILAATVPSGILAEDCDATAGDASCIVYTGGRFMASGIIWGAMSHPVATEALRDVGIVIESVMSQPGSMVKGVELPSETVRVDDTAITKEPNPKEIITATGPVPVTAGETDTTDKTGSFEPHPAPLRVQPGETQPPTEEDAKHKDKANKPPQHHTPPKPNDGGSKK